MNSFNVKDLLLIKNDAATYYKEFPNGKKLPDARSKLSDGDVLALSYYHAIVQHLKRTGVLDKSFDGVIMFDEANSRTGG